MPGFIRFKGPSPAGNNVNLAKTIITCFYASAFPIIPGRILTLASSAKMPPDSTSNPCFCQYSLTSPAVTSLRLRDLMCAFASHLVMKGLDLTTVRELLGHATLTMTLRYAHLAHSHVAKAVAVLDVGMKEQGTGLV